MMEKTGPREDRPNDTWTGKEGIMGLSTPPTPLELVRGFALNILRVAQQLEAAEAVIEHWRDDIYISTNPEDVAIRDAWEKAKVEA
jgi:hypothetical protein